MNPTYTTYPSDYGYGYRIYYDDALQVEQAFKPGVPGFVAMNEAEAIAEAEAALAAMLSE